MSKSSSSSPGLDTSASYIPNPLTMSVPSSSTTGLVGRTISGVSGTDTTEINTCAETRVALVSAPRYLATAQYSMQELARVPKGPPTLKDPLQKVWWSLSTSGSHTCAAASFGIPALCQTWLPLPRGTSGHSPSKSKCHCHTCHPAMSIANRYIVGHVSNNILRRCG